MKVPARFLRFRATHAGATSAEGWLEIDVRALDLDGVTKLYVDLAEVARVREKRDQATGALDAWDAAFGRTEDDAPPPSA